MANNLSEQEILNDSLLNSLLYMDELELSRGITLSEAILNTEANNNGQWETPLGVTGGKPEALIDYIKSNPELGDLKIVGYTCGEEMSEFQEDVNNGLDVNIESGGPVIVALENEETKEVTFVFRGTNSLEWLDNAEGFMDESSRLQEQALEFFEKTVEENGYDKEPWKINVTGHSKGGNKAQYVTIKSKYEVNKCVSIDGQGFSNAFIQNNQQRIDERSDKITTICADMDYVNVLGHSIAGDTIIYDSNQPDPVQVNYSQTQEMNSDLSKTELNYLMAHSCTALYHIENGQIMMNDVMPDRKTLPKELAEMSEYVMDNCTPDEQSTIFYAVMNIFQHMFQNGIDKDPILNNQQKISIKETKEGIGLILDNITQMKSREDMASMFNLMYKEAKQEGHFGAATIYKVCSGWQKAMQKFDGVTAKAKKVFNAVTYPAQSAINTGKKLVQAAKNFGKNVVEDTLDLGKQQTEAVVDYTQDIVNDTAQLNHETTQAVVESTGVGGALDAAKNVINKIKDKFSKTKENVKDTFDKVGNFAKDTIDTVEKVGDSAKDLAQDVAEDTVEYGKDVAEDTIEYGQNVGQAIAGNTYVQGAVSAGKDALNNVKDKTEQAVDAVKDKAKDVKDAAKDAAAKVDDFVEDKTHYKEKAEAAKEFADEAKKTAGEIGRATEEYKEDIKQDTNDLKENVQKDTNDFKNDVKESKQNTQINEKLEKGERLTLKERIELSKQVRKEKEEKAKQPATKNKSNEHDL